MSELDKNEFEKLTALASTLVGVLHRTNPNQIGVTALLATALGRIESLQQEGVLHPEQDEKRKNRSSQETAIAAIVARETRLSKEEQAIYADFLDKEAFEKKDLKKLEHFYTHSYDKLSDEGKAQMSQRIEEGIERGHLKRSDLPAVIQERHAANQATKNEVSQSHSESEQQTLFENHNKSTQIDDEKSTQALSSPQKSSTPETASTQDAELLAKSFEGISFAATDLPKASETSPGRTA